MITTRCPYCEKEYEYDACQDYVVGAKSVSVLLTPADQVEIFRCTKKRKIDGKMKPCNGVIAISVLEDNGSSVYVPGLEI